MTKINLNKKPYIPKGWKLESHTKGGMFEWNPRAVELYLSEKQKSSYIKGTELQKELKDKNPFNANLLDYLLANPDLIPDEWKGQWVFFWGTIYRRSSGNLFVRFLRWNGGEWNWRYYWLDCYFNDNDPSAVFARSVQEEKRYKVNKNGCWNWDRAIDRYGYGKVVIIENKKRKHLKAHRFIFEKEKGKIEENMTLDHLCNNRKCVNPEHLEVVTIAENVRRGKSAKLNYKAVDEIKKLYEEGNKINEIASMFGVSHSSISRVVNGKSWVPARGTKTLETSETLPSELVINNVKYKRV